MLLISQSSVLPAHLEHPPPTIITAIPKCANPHLLATAARPGKLFIESGTVSNASFDFNIEHPVKSVDQFSVEPGYATANHWRRFAYITPQSVSQSEDSSSRKACVTWCCASDVCSD